MVGKSLEEIFVFNNYLSILSSTAINTQNIQKTFLEDLNKVTEEKLKTNNLKGVLELGLEGSSKFYELSTELEQIAESKPIKVKLSFTMSRPYSQSSI